VLERWTMQSRRRDHIYTRPRAAILDIHALPKLRRCRAVEDAFSCSDIRRIRNDALNDSGSLTHHYSEYTAVI